MKGNPNPDVELPEVLIPSETTEFLSEKPLDYKIIPIDDLREYHSLEDRKFIDEADPKPSKVKAQKLNKQTSLKTSQNSIKKAKGWQNYGILFILCSGLMFSTVGMIVKYLKGYHALNLAFFRFQGMFLPAIPFLLYVVFVKKQSVFEPIWPISERSKLKTIAVLVGRGITGCIALVCHFYAIQYMTVADAMVIGSCSPVLVAIVAHLFLGEKCGAFPVLIAILTIFGVGIIARPPLFTGEEEYNMDTLIGSGFALGRMCMTSVAIVFLRYLRGVHVAVVLCVAGGVQLFQSTSMSLIMGVFSLPTDPFHLALGALIGLASFLGQLCMTLALKCEQAGPFAIVRTFDTVFAFILQFIFLGVVPDVFSLVGAAVVIVAVCLTVFRKWLGSLPNDHRARKTYWIVLK